VTALADFLLPERTVAFGRKRARHRMGSFDPQETLRWFQSSRSVLKKPTLNTPPASTALKCQFAQLIGSSAIRSFVAGLVPEALRAS